MFYLIIDTVRGMSYLASCTVLYVFYSLLIMDFFQVTPSVFPLSLLQIINYEIFDNILSVRDVQVVGIVANLHVLLVRVVWIWSQQCERPHGSPTGKNPSIALEVSVEPLHWNFGAVVNELKIFLGATLHTRPVVNELKFSLGATHREKFSRKNA